MVTQEQGGSGRKRATKVPIRAHPAFPLIVAVWFSALLGIGSLMVPTVMLEKLIEPTGASLIIPAAQPPLGSTAQLIFALAAAALGAAIGLIVARAISAIPAKPAAASSGKAKKPIVPHEELGSDSLDQPIQDNAIAFADEPAFRAPAAEFAEAEFTDREDIPDEGLSPVSRWLIARPLDELGTLELVERLALSLQRREPARRTRINANPQAMTIAANQDNSEAWPAMNSNSCSAQGGEAGMNAFNADIDQSAPVSRIPGSLQRRNAPFTDTAAPSEPDLAAADHALHRALEKLQRLSGAA